MKKKVLITCWGCFTLLLCVLFSSCEAGNHAYNKWKLGLQRDRCLAQAQTVADSSACQESYENDLDAENTRHEEAVNREKEIDACYEFQKDVLNIWGYSEKESKEIAKKLKKKSLQTVRTYDSENDKYVSHTVLSDYAKSQDYTFDGGEAITELIMFGCTDNNGLHKFQKELPTFGLSVNDAEKAIKSYYAEGFYEDRDENGNYRNPYHSKNSATEYLMHIKIGNDIRVTKKILIDMGLLDEDEGNDEGDDEGDDNEKTPTNPEPKTPNPIEPTDTYQTEANAISQMVISKYGFNKATLSSEQKQELYGVVAFLKKWPDATVTIVGHTCNIGSDDNNNIVGMRRAQQAKLYITSQGIDESRINEVSKAAEEPCAGNDTEEGRQANRRITFIVK